MARLGAQFLDVLQGLTTLKIFNCEKQQLQIIAKASDDYRRKTMGVLRIAFISSAVLELFSSVAIAMLAVYLGLCLLGQIHFGNYGHFISLNHALFILLLAPEFFMPLRQLGVHYHARAEAIAAATEILKIFEMPLPKANGHKILTDNQKISIRFADISFGYHQRNKILENISFTIKTEEHVAIVGPSGIGKTTLLNLIMGFIQPQQCTLFINFSSLNEIDLEQRRKKIA